jgi:hypothetical protein
MAGVPGFEPGMSVPKTDALPLGHTPLNHSIYLAAFFNNFKPNYELLLDFLLIVYLCNIS